ncbi:MAG TPA: MBL fold metallo-hydrolase [Tepidisphaeraceae bacterium]|jgi:L-ascorbate metabolism protein UlaG (beta-lactamase superfamily)|nr:MBL fold metallo-hydrolase [Tepidisphaeraceae bacterium]
MIQPLLQDQAFLADVAAARIDPDTVHLWWLGQSGFLVQHGGRHLLFDPYLSDSLTRKYQGTEKPHVRMTQRVIAPQLLDFVDVITSTHNHTDHLDADTIVPIVRAAAQARNAAVSLVLPAANVEFATNRLHEALPQIAAIQAGQHLNVAGFEFTAVPAAHDRLATDERGRHLYLGLIVRMGNVAIYHSGDTIVYDGMADLLLPHKIDIAILPINGKVANMGGADAAGLASDIGAKWVIPCHYDMFEFNTASPAEEFIPECRRLGQPFKVLQAGERFSADGCSGRPSSF